MFSKVIFLTGPAVTQVDISEVIDSFALPVSTRCRRHQHAWTHLRCARSPRSAHGGRFAWERTSCSGAAATVLLSTARTDNNSKGGCAPSPSLCAPPRTYCSPFSIGWCTCSASPPAIVTTTHCPNLTMTAVCG
ncbi:hypothetical protein Zmor_010650 [Zophobas morio]|uniref:Uncharacterized protein n=1 Tax=Zophobas morio TaxID=2755281 RepID=A0AA38IP48_9CUCU|nr:hypothetical protein Zmor_010650 [Zophobas morio]